MAEKLTGMFRTMHCAARLHKFYQRTSSSIDGNSFEAVQPDEKSPSCSPYSVMLVACFQSVIELKSVRVQFSKGHASREISVAPLHSCN